VSWHNSREDVTILNVDCDAIGNPEITDFSGFMRFDNSDWIIDFHGHIVYTL